MKTALNNSQLVNPVGNLTGLTTVSKSTAVSAINSLSNNYYGYIYNKSSWSNLSDFYVNGVIVSATTGNTLQFSGGTGTYTQTLDLNTGSSSGTALNKWKQTLTIIAPNPTSTTYGLGLSIRSTNTQGSYNGAQTHISFASGGNLGSLTIALLPSAVVVSTSTSNIPVASGDTIILTFERNINILTATVYNQTQASAIITTSYVYSVAYPISYSMPNTGKFGISNYGGVINVTSYSVFSNEIINADILFAGDSKTVGYYSGVPTGGFGYLVGNKFSTVINAGGNDETADLLLHMNEIIALKPKSVVVEIGCNDIRYGVTLSTIEANINTFYNTVTAAGIPVYFLSYLNETTGLNQVPLDTYIQTNYSSVYINCKSNTYSTSYFVGPDGIHPTQAGHQIAANAIISSGFFTNTSNIGGNTGTALAFPYYNLNGQLTASSYINTTDGSNMLIGYTTPVVTEKLGIRSSADAIMYTERNSIFNQNSLAFGTNGTLSTSNLRWIIGQTPSGNTAGYAYNGLDIYAYDGTTSRLALEFTYNGTNAVTRVGTDLFFNSTVAGYGSNMSGQFLNSSGLWQASQVSAIQWGSNNYEFAISLNRSLTIGNTFTPTYYYKGTTTGWMPQQSNLQLGGSSNIWGLTYATNYISKPTLTSVNSSTTLTAAQIQTGILTNTTASVAFTLPTAASLATQIGAVNGTTMMFTIDNVQSSLSGNITLTLGSAMNWGIVTGATIPIGKAQTYLIYFPNITACTISQIL